jgi:putative membrane protein
MHATLLTLPANDNWDGAWFWPLVPLVWLIAIVLLIRFVFWGRGRCGSGGGGPHRILGERYARGEISHDEYRERLSHLEGR